MESRVARRRYPLIERRVGVDGGTVLRDYIAQGLPVVVRTADAGRRRRWDPEALRSGFGDCLIEAEETEEVFVGERARRPLRLAQIVDGVLAGDTSLRWKGLDLIASVAGMKEHVATNAPSSDPLLPDATESTRRALWLAPRGTMSSFHHDGNSDNYNWQIYGKKLFLLVPPSGFDDLYAYGSAESPINPFHPELARFPRFARVAPLEATLEPGDVLLIPKYWWHCVYTVEPSVNLNTWFTFRGELSPWRALAGAPLLYRSCSAVVAEMKRHGLFRTAKAARSLWYGVYARLKDRPTPEARGELLDP